VCRRCVVLSGGDGGDRSTRRRALQHLQVARFESECPAGRDGWHPQAGGFLFVNRQIQPRSVIGKRLRATKAMRYAARHS
jgi:hypothetical protein